MGKTWRLFFLYSKIAISNLDMPVITVKNAKKKRNILHFEHPFSRVKSTADCRSPSERVFPEGHRARYPATLKFYNKCTVLSAAVDQSASAFFYNMDESVKRL